MGIMISDTMQNTSNAYKKIGLTSPQHVIRILVNLSRLYNPLLQFDAFKNRRFIFYSHRMYFWKFVYNSV